MSKCAVDHDDRVVASCELVRKATLLASVHAWVTRPGDFDRIGERLAAIEGAGEAETVCRAIVREQFPHDIDAIVIRYEGWKAGPLPR